MVIILKAISIAASQHLIIVLVVVLVLVPSLRSVSSVYQPPNAVAKTIVPTPQHWIIKLCLYWCLLSVQYLLFTFWRPNISLVLGTQM